MNDNQISFSLQVLNGGENQTLRGGPTLTLSALKKAVLDKVGGDPGDHQVVVGRLLDEETLLQNSGLTPGDYVFLVKMAPTRARLRLVDRFDRTKTVMVTQSKALLGRPDPDSGVNPDVDLTVFASRETGVSRTQAYVEEGDGRWFVISHPDSRQPTFLNEQKVSPGDRREMVPGSVLAFGGTSNTPVVQLIVEYDA